MHKVKSMIHPANAINNVGFEPLSKVTMFVITADTTVTEFTISVSDVGLVVVAIVILHSSERL